MPIMPSNTKAGGDPLAALSATSEIGRLLAPSEEEAQEVVLFLENPGDRSVPQALSIAVTPGPRAP